MKQVKGHGFIRKNKAGKVVSGVVLGTALFMAGGVASADEVKPTEVKPTETVVTEAKAEEKTDKVETKETPKAEVKDQEGLDKKYSELTEQAKKQDVEVKEGEKVTHDTVESASKDLDEQSKKIDELAKGRDEANAKLQKAIEDAKAVGIKVELGDKVTYSELAKGEEDVAKQIEELTALTTKVKDAQGRLAKVVADAKQAGVKFEGVKSVELKDVEEAEKAINEIIAQQKSVDAELNKAVADAKAKGVNVTVEGETVVSPKDAEKAIADAKAKIAKALAEKEKADADYATALKNATETSRLMNGSTATKEGNVYKQSLTIKSGGAKGSVSLKTTGSADILSVELIDPSGKKVESIKTLSDLTSYTDFGKEGNYTLNYTFRAKDNTSGSVVSSASTQGTATVEGKEKGTFSLTTKASSSSQTKDAKRRIIMLLDRSSSFNDKNGENYVNALADKVIDSMNPGDELALVGSENTLNFLYPSLVHNYSDFSSDKEALKRAVRTKDGDKKIEKRLGANPISSQWQSWIKSKTIKDAFTFNGFTEKDVTVVSLLDDTAVDTPDSSTYLQFKQFKDSGGKVLAYIPNVAGSKSTERIFKQAGVEDSNIEYVEYARQDPTPVANKIVKSLTSKTVVQVKGEEQTVTFSIVGTNTAKVTKATLKGATNKDLPIKDGKINFTEKLPDGSWTVEYELSGDGEVTVTATVDGKEVVKETKNLKNVKGVEGSTNSKTDNLNAVVLPKAPEVKPEGVKVSKISLKTEEPKVATIKAKAHEIAVSSGVHPVDVVKPVVATPIKPQLPLTGTTASVALVMAGMGALTLAGATLKKKEN